MREQVMNCQASEFRTLKLESLEIFRNVRLQVETVLVNELKCNDRREKLAYGTKLQHCSLRIDWISPSDTRNTVCFYERSFSFSDYNSHSTWKQVPRDRGPDKRVRPTCNAYRLRLSYRGATN